ncbi:hypothetical protein F5148DRAFT_1221522 [Russula earlei]|uniref:Uncharacterized protein n=1 Tax=Russula earlei TaxID=71964 RepID=A0ACC0U2E1_9AGAM|nr:hypothetical protein F5148DRAFT_1221522 [Russula earlei]
MSSTLPLPPKPDFEPLSSRTPPERRQRSPRRSPPPRSRPPYGDSYQPDYRSRYRDAHGSSRHDSDGRGRDRDDRRYDSRRYEPERRDYDHRRDHDHDRSRDNDSTRDGRVYNRDRGRDYETRENNRGRVQRDNRNRDRRRNTPPRRRSRSRRRDDRSWSPRRRSTSRDRRWRSPTPPPRRSSPRRRSPDARSTADVKKNSPLSSRLSAPPEPKSPLQPDRPADVWRPRRDPSPSPASPQPPSSSETRLSPTPVSSTPLDKGKAKVTPQPAANINEDVKMIDLVPPHSPQHIVQPRKPSPTATNLTTNPKRSRNSHSQTNPATSNATRSSSSFRMPPIPPHEVKEVVKESLNKEASRSPFRQVFASPHTRTDGLGFLEPVDRRPFFISIPLRQ